MRWKRVKCEAAWVHGETRHPIEDATALVVFDEGTNCWRDPCDRGEVEVERAALGIGIDSYEPVTETCGFFLYGDGMPGPWWQGLVMCRECEHRWIAVWPEGREPLECPVCGKRKGDRLDA